MQAFLGAYLNYFLLYNTLQGGANINKLKIPENHSGVSKTLRLPENIVNDVQNLANLKNLSFNRVVISLLEFGLNNLDEKDKEELKKSQK